MSKRLLIYLNSMNAFGGIERVIANLSNHLCNYYDITILVKDEPISAYQLDQRITLDSLHVPLEMDMTSWFRRILSVPVNAIKSVRALRRYFKNHTFDVIYTAFPMNGLEIYLSKKYYRNKLIASEHASYYAYNKIYRLVKQYLYPRLQAISVPTTMDTNIYQDLGYQAFYMPHLTTFAPSLTQPEDTKTIINVGRLTSDKQQLLLLQIWEKVNEKLPGHEWKLQIIGSGEEEESLKTYIQTSGLTNVEMIPHTTRIADYYKNAELFAFTSKMEGFGMVLLEAMSFGVPCISFDCPSGPRDMISNNQNGYLVEPFDLEAYAECICQYIQLDSSSKNRYKEAAKETIINWDNDAIISSWLELISKMEKNK